VRFNDPDEEKGVSTGMGTSTDMDDNVGYEVKGGAPKTETPIEEKKPAEKKGFLYSLATGGENWDMNGIP
jgi:hypothetical protein